MGNSGQTSAGERNKLGAVLYLFQQILMRYMAVACDYDGTLALDGSVDEETLEALHRLRSSGRRLILVTGRHLAELLSVFGRADIFDLIVAENGATLYEPRGQTEKALAEPLPDSFVRLLKE